MASPIISRSTSPRRRPGPGRGPPQLAGPYGVVGVEVLLRLVDVQPAVLGPGLEALQEAAGSGEPPLGDRQLAAEVGVVGPQPARHACRSEPVPHRPVEVVGALSRFEHDRGIVQPPGGPAQTLERLGGLRLRDGRLEYAASVLPFAARQSGPARGNPVRALCLGVSRCAQAPAIIACPSWVSTSPWLTSLADGCRGSAGGRPWSPLAG